MESKDRRINNCRILTVGHVSNVPGTMESCPTYVCDDPKTLSNKAAELEKLRRELLRLIVKNEALRQAARKCPTK